MTETMTENEIVASISAMKIDELLALNKIIVRAIRAKQNLENSIATSTLLDGDKVVISLPRDKDGLDRSKAKIIKVNRVNCRVKILDGIQEGRIWNVPASCLSKS